MRIALTGATGFIGGHLLAALTRAGHDPIVLSRGDLSRPTARLEGAHALIHVAAIAHARGTDRTAYDAANRDLPLRLADAARSIGVTRFVFVSSINAATRPDTPYGASKAAAERGLLAMPGLEPVIVRPPPVYGPDARGGFALLVRLAASPLPLPFGGTRNRRTIIAVDNLVDALLFATVAPRLGGQTFTATDPGPPPTLAGIVTALRAGLGRTPGLFPGPADLLFRETIVDGGALFAAGWVPPRTTQEALGAVAKAAR
jgi:UDP-glucose 4-epimerase